MLENIHPLLKIRSQNIGFMTNAYSIVVRCWGVVPTSNLIYLTDLWLITRDRLQNWGINYICLHLALPSRIIKAYCEVLLKCARLMIIILWSWYYAWTQGHHLLRALEALILLWISFYTCTHTHLCVCVRVCGTLFQNYRKML